MIRTMRARWLAAAVAALLLPGCGKGSEPPKASAPAKQETVRPSRPAAELLLATVDFPLVAVPSDAVEITIRKDKTYWEGNRNLGSEPEIEKRLHEIANRGKGPDGISETLLVIRADEECVWAGDVMMVVWHAKDSSIYRIGFAARRPNKGGEGFLPFDYPREALPGQRVVRYIERKEEMEKVLLLLSVIEGSVPPAVVCRVNQAPVPFDTADPSAKALRTHLEGLLRTVGGAPLTLEAHWGVPAGDALRALGAAMSAGFKDINLAVPTFKVAVPGSKKQNGPRPR